MLELENICVYYSYKKVLDGISVKFDQGKIYSLLGENGAGKTTMAKVISGFIKPTAGKIFLNDKHCYITNPAAAIKNHIVYVHQHPLISKSLTVEQNLSIGIKKNLFKDLLKSQKITTLMSKWLPGKTLSDKTSDFTDEECFYTSFINVLLKDPAIILLDEPPAIDEQELRELATSGITIIIITHNLSEAIQKSDYVILLQNGHIFQQSKTNEITEDQIKQKLYGISRTVNIPECIEIRKMNENSVQRISGKIGYIPSDKNQTASNPNLTITQLATAFNPKGSQKELKRRTSEILRTAEVNIKEYEKAKNLSGGMLQRLILERELAEKPEELIMFNPIHGLDVEATEKLYAKLESTAADGTKIIFGVDK